MRTASDLLKARRIVAVLVVVGAVLLGVLTTLAGPAAAKGPVPMAPEPSGSLREGEATEVVVLLEWPGGEFPQGMNPEFADFWGDDLPWRLVAVPGTLSPGQTDVDGEELTLTHDGELRYTASFTPANAGEWTLAMVWRETSVPQPPFAVTVVQVAEPDGGAPVVAAVGGGAIFVLLLAVVILWSRSRHPAPIDGP